MEEMMHHRSPFGDFLAMMAEMGAADHVWATIDICARYGGFYADETRCLIARPVDSSIGIDYLNGFADLDEPLLSEMNVDAWFILYASGDIKSFFELAPYDLPWLVWQRNGSGAARIYDFQKIKHRVAMSPPKPPAPPKPDPNTVASGIDQNAAREAELERKRRAGFYSGMRKPVNTGAPVGGEFQTVG